ncbi:MAG: hypothetical protein RhofKO_21970 [Rhodothermales bacterium]
MRDLVFTVSIFLTGCMVIGPAEDTVLITSPASVYTINTETVIEVSLTNATSDTLIYNSCDVARLERIDNGQVAQTWWQAQCLCLCYEKLAPGEMLDHGYRLESASEGDQTTLPEGTYRLGLPPLYASTRFEPEIRLEGLVSAVFTLRNP